MTSPSERRKDVVGNIYLLHFTRPYLHAGHYLGWTEGPVEERIARHRSGHGSPLVACVMRLGQDVILAREWNGVTRAEERRLKIVGGLARQCPICKAKKKKKEEEFLKTVAWG
jgi:hypothetical protein